MSARFAATILAFALQLAVAFRKRSTKQAPDQWAQAVMPCLQGPAAVTTESMTSADYDAAYASVASRYNSLSPECNYTSCPQADWAGCVLRAAGHDFMDFQGSTGGSDGCLDLHDPENNGLRKCLYEGEFGVSVLQAYQEHCLKVSLADFLVIAGETVMHLTRQNALQAGTSRMALDFKAGFMYGRTTAETCPWSLGRIPDAERSCTGVGETFLESMGLSWRESAALMGVHTLGRARPENSGYSGFWSDPHNSRLFNNNYFIAILDRGWRPRAVNGNPSRNQWDRTDEGCEWGTCTSYPEGSKEMMLNTDLCLAFTGGPAGKDGWLELNAGEEIASNDPCCAWRFSSNEVFSKDSTNYFAKGAEFCGNLDYPTDSAGERIQQRLCCGGRARDCGDPMQLAGPAFYDVKEFSLSEESWLQAFLPAWRKATSNGASNLKPLM